MRERRGAMGSPDVLQEYLKNLPSKKQKEMKARARQRSKDTISFALRLTGENVAPKEVLGQKIVDSVWQKLIAGESASVGKSREDIAESVTPRNAREARLEEGFLHRFGEEFRKSLLHHDFTKVDELYSDAVQVSNEGKSLRGVALPSRSAMLDQVSRSCTEVIVEMASKRDDWDIATILSSRSSFLNHLFTDPYFVRVAGRIVPLTEPSDKKQSSAEFLRLALSLAVSDAVREDSVGTNIAYNPYSTALDRVRRFGISVPDINEAIRSPLVRREIKESLRRDLSRLSDFSKRDQIGKSHGLELHLQDKVRRLRVAKVIDEKTFTTLVREIASEYKSEHGEPLKKLIVYKPVEPEG